jgi:glycosyltransferase involved in cell wall biosynthesis
MKVAVLTTRAAAPDVGGAERFYDGLVAALRDAGNEATEISVPADERNFDAIEGSYLHAWDLDMSAYDMVVSTKAPTYMVRHPRHVCYLVHTMRVFYDMFDESYPAPPPILRRQRALVQRLDTLALGRVGRKFFSIGHEVSRRLERFNRLNARVLHPPLSFDGFHPGPQGDYVFMPGRLHRWKRVALAIEAMRHVATPVRLVIAGSGEHEAELREAAADLPRVTFAGRVSDAELVRLYAGALAVAFVPLREDYGYVAIEGARSAKPVVTCRDSGEPAHLVRDGATGLVVEPTPAALAAAFDRLWNDRAGAAAMGASARAITDDMRWDTVARALLAA